MAGPAYQVLNGQTMDGEHKPADQSPSEALDRIIGLIRMDPSVGERQLHECLHRGILTLICQSTGDKTHTRLEADRILQTAATAVRSGEIRNAAELLSYVRRQIVLLRPSQKPSHCVSVEELNLMAGCLQAQSAESREILRRFYVEAEPVETIAGALSVSPEVIREVLRHAKSDFLKRRGGAKFTLPCFLLN